MIVKKLYPKPLLMIRDRIWDELCQVAFKVNYCRHLSTYQRKWLMWVNLITLLFSLAGILGWPVWKISWLSTVALIITALVQLLKLVQNQVVPSEAQIEKLDKITFFYANHFDKLEILWLDCNYYRCTEEDLQTRFYILHAEEHSQLMTINSVIKFVNRMVRKQSELDTREKMERLKQYKHINYEQRTTAGETSQPA